MPVQSIKARDRPVIMQPYRAFAFQTVLNFKFETDDFFHLANFGDYNRFLGSRLNFVQNFERNKNAEFENSQFSFDHDFKCDWFKSNETK